MAAASAAVVVAKAERAIARVGLASMIETNRLSPRSVISVMRYSSHPKAAEDCALLLLVAGMADPEAWHGERRRARHQAVASSTSS
jgi:hypothetical protein